MNLSFRKRTRAQPCAPKQTAGQFWGSISKEGNKLKCHHCIFRNPQYWMLPRNPCSLPLPDGGKTDYRTRKLCQAITQTAVISAKLAGSSGQSYSHMSVQALIQSAGYIFHDQEYSVWQKTSCFPEFSESLRQRPNAAQAGKYGQTWQKPVAELIPVVRT